ncbi:MAG TPA: response regulator, partial [Candidatus Ozemobacteraceae bacterium]|nr:response regulator [Candidatus Ozemobacteraceae bacterium]
MKKSEERKPCILIVDDVADNIIMLDGLLRDTYQVKAAGSGEKALKILATGPRPDLIILDIMMPEMDGFEVCRRLKADPALADIPVIFLTARNFVEDETAGLDAGAVDFIAKPVHPPIVLARVRTHLLLKQARDVLRQRNELLENNLRAAARIQENLLPKQDLKDERLRCRWRFRPSETVGGDLLNYFLLDRDHVGAYILDVAGHGLPAAMVTFAI